jgi:hypothetical protein
MFIDFIQIYYIILNDDVKRHPLLKYIGIMLGSYKRQNTSYICNAPAKFSKKYVYAQHTAVKLKIMLIFFPSYLLLNS